MVGCGSVTRTTGRRSYLSGTQTETLSQTKRRKKEEVKMDTIEKGGSVVHSMSQVPVNFRVSKLGLLRLQFWESPP